MGWGGSWLGAVGLFFCVILIIVIAVILLDFLLGGGCMAGRGIGLCDKSVGPTVGFSW